MQITSQYYPKDQLMVITLKGRIIGQEVEHLKIRLGEMLPEMTLEKIILNCEHLSMMDQKGQRFLKHWADEMVRHNVRMTMILSY